MVKAQHIKYMLSISRGKTHEYWKNEWNILLTHRALVCECTALLVLCISLVLGVR